MAEQRFQESKSFPYQDSNGISREITLTITARYDPNAPDPGAPGGSIYEPKMTAEPCNVLEQQGPGSPADQIKEPAFQWAQEQVGKLALAAGYSEKFIQENPNLISGIANYIQGNAYDSCKGVDNTQTQYASAEPTTMTDAAPGGYDQGNGNIGASAASFEDRFNAANDLSVPGWLSSMASVDPAAAAALQGGATETGGNTLSPAQIINQGFDAFDQTSTTGPTFSDIINSFPATNPGAFSNTPAATDPASSSPSSDTPIDPSTGLPGNTSDPFSPAGMANPGGGTGSGLGSTTSGGNYGSNSSNYNVVNNGGNYGSNSSNYNVANNGGNYGSNSSNYNVANNGGNYLVTSNNYSGGGYDGGGYAPVIL